MTAVEELIRWQAAGGHWRVVERSGGRVTVSLVTCDGGDEMSRITAPIEEVESYLNGRDNSEDES